MNRDVIEILSILIKKMLNDQDLWLEQDEIIIELEDSGYSIENIKAAFTVVFNEVITAGDQDFYIDYAMKSGYNRVFTKTEKVYFDNDVRKLILKLNKLGILSADQLEIIIFRMMDFAVYNELKPDLVWEIINDVVEDNETLYLISDEIAEFNSSILKYQRVN